MLKYFIYCRKSTEDEERQILSIEAQLTELREYAKREGLLVVKEFTESQSSLLLSSNFYAKSNGVPSRSFDFRSEGWWSLLDGEEGTVLSRSAHSP